MSDAQEFEWYPDKAERNYAKHGILFDDPMFITVVDDEHSITSHEDYELREEYDLAKMIIVPKGRFSPDRRRGQNVVVLAPDVAKAFPTDEAVNEALRLVLQIANIPKR